MTNHISVEYDASTKSLTLSMISSKAIDYKTTRSSIYEQSSNVDSSERALTDIAKTAHSISEPFYKKFKEYIKKYSTDFKFDAIDSSQSIKIDIDAFKSSSDVHEFLTSYLPKINDHRTGIFVLDVFMPLFDHLYGIEDDKYDVILPSNMQTILEAADNTPATDVDNEHTIQR